VGTYAACLTFAYKSPPYYLTIDIQKELLSFFSKLPKRINHLNALLFDTRERNERLSYITLSTSAIVKKPSSSSASRTIVNMIRSRQSGYCRLSNFYIASCLSSMCWWRTCVSKSSLKLLFSRLVSQWAERSATQLWLVTRSTDFSSS